MRKLILFCCVLGLVSTASAQSKMGPSARAAAKLKKSPPPTWIQHYLPDDRYKIAGKVWKFVSTEIDRSYHMPYSDFMLKQSPNNVIGFASAEEAEDAGYKPGPSVPVVIVVKAQDLVKARHYQANFEKAQRIERARQAAEDAAEFRAAAARARGIANGLIKE